MAEFPLSTAESGLLNTSSLDESEIVSASLSTITGAMPEYVLPPVPPPPMADPEIAVIEVPSPSSELHGTIELMDDAEFHTDDTALIEEAST
jgi:hypothetical protein